MKTYPKKHLNMKKQSIMQFWLSIVNHQAKEALMHAKKAAEVAIGESKTHMDAAVKSLESALEHGKTPAAEHLKAAEETKGTIKAGINNLHKKR